MNEITTRKIATDLKLIREDVDELIKATVSQTGGRIAALRQRLAKKLEDGRKALTEKTWLKTAEDSKAQTESRLRQNPWTGVAIAVGLGAVVGWLLRRD